MVTLQTDFRKEKEKMERTVYADFVRLASAPGAAKTDITRRLMKKYHIHSPTTIWSIRKRMEARLQGEA